MPVVTAKNVLLYIKLILLGTMPSVTSTDKHYMYDDIHLNTYAAYIHFRPNS